MRNRIDRDLEGYNTEIADALRDRIAVLQCDLAAAKAALEPFAKAARTAPDDWPGSDELSLGLILGDLRRAASIVAKE